MFTIRYGYEYFQNKQMMQDDIEKTSVRETVVQPIEIQKDEELDVQPVIEIPSGAEEEPIQRQITGEHKVLEGENFSLITGFYWDDIFLWPDLYIRNSMRSDDPDLIYPDEIVTIYNRLGTGNNFSTRETEEILEAYLQVYEIYKKLGAEKNNSVWSLLWCAARYDHDFLDTYKDRIDPADRAMAQKYIDEQGFLD
ncbi:hypothetical protein EXM22_17090 [Oceanispirochaeta crateris]|uniref:LysM domain-containing protein n=1 Tax=Oceanispirochaeta crateris TaxID=2518645 RepID=A0A5C1QSI7_9SPIO|nr:hypothetical protein [Oceanispirochaeta crateris]QEN09614.1 hypothetical protein EXM22_17090 [Oceanispirochaeta crateris]